jgi:hypothetical protein
MSTRRIVGPVAGGHPARDFPQWPSPGQFDSQTLHARGRMQAMADVLFNLVKLKSAGIIKAEDFISFGGATVQDFDPPGPRGYVAAHRAIGGALVNSWPAHELKAVVSICGLQEKIWAPEARTDFVQPGSVNYADGMIERAAMPHLRTTFEDFLRWQPAGKPVEYNLLAEGINVLKNVLLRSYTDVMNNYDERLELRGKPSYPIDRVREGLRSLEINRSMGKKLPDPPFRHQKRVDFLEDFAAARKELDIDPLDAPGPLAGHNDGRMAANPSEDPYAPYVVIGLQREEHVRFSPDLVATDVIKEKSAQIDKIISDSNRSASA